MTSLITGLESVTKTIKQCLINENIEHGLLEDVEEIITVYNNEDGIETPGVWMVQHPTTARNRVDLRQELILVSPFEFICVEYDPDPEIAEEKSQNLATRVAIAVLKNYLSVQQSLGYTRTISNIEFNTYMPVGEITPRGKAEKVPVTGIILDVVHRVNWYNCCRQLESISQQTETTEPTETTDDEVTDTTDNNNDEINEQEEDIGESK